MVAQVLWLFISYALIATIAALLLEAEMAIAAAGVVILVPALRIWRRFGPGRGYFMLGRTADLGAIRHRSFRATRQDYPQLFWFMLAIEIAILSFILVSAISHSSYQFGAACDEYMKCKLGSGMHEVCFD